jgi:[acyl-carrier-protein] S-malonyltransferase
MKMAEERLASSLGAAAFSRAEVPVISNVTAEAVTDPEVIESLLERQLTSPVMWCQSMEYLAAQGVTSVVEVGPGKVLCGLLKRIDASMQCRSCGDCSSIEAFQEGFVV